MIATEDRLKDYRKRAEELRKIAEGISDEKNKKLLLGVADDYLRMALALEDARKALNQDNLKGPNEKGK